jgi:hypothetical protein
MIAMGVLSMFIVVDTLPAQMGMPSQPQIQVSDPVPEAQQAGAEQVEELLVAMQVKDHVSKTMDQMLSMQMRVHPEGSAVIDATREFYEKYMSWDAVKGGLIEIYQETFTADEVAALTGFYQTPAGQKMIEKMPELSSRSMKVTMERMGKHMNELREMLKEARLKDGLPENDGRQLGPFPPQGAGGMPAAGPRKGRPMMPKRTMPAAPVADQGAPAVEETAVPPSQEATADAEE